MKLYHNLNLPPVIKNGAKDFILSNWNSSYKLYNNFSPELLLTEEVLRAFTQINITPINVIVFKKGDTSKVRFGERTLHRDIIFDVLQNKWVSVCAGVNIELTQSENTLLWFDIEKSDEVYPGEGEKDSPNLRKSNGIHYLRRINQGVQNDVIFLGSKKIKHYPVLVRTDIHHISAYVSSEPRIGISIRFDEKSYNHNWNEAVAKFLPYISP